MHNNSTIVSNTVDITASANDAQFVFHMSANVTDQLSQLIAYRQDWDKLNYAAAARSNKNLYQILSPIYNMGVMIEDNLHPDQDIKGTFDGYCKAHLIKFHNDTSYFVRICKVVFGANGSNRYSAYGNAMIVAKAEGTQIGGLIDFLENEGGIEEARRLHSPKKARETITDKANKSVDQVAANSLARITDQAICSKVDKSVMNGKAVLFVSIEDDGTLSVHAISQADKLVNRVVVALSNQATTATGGEVNNTNNQ